MSESSTTSTTADTKDKTGTVGTSPATTGATGGKEITRDVGPDGGRTSIADTVVAKIAGIATREVPGVYALGGGAARAVGALRERIPGTTNHSQGISVEVGERQAAVDIQLIIEFGVNIKDLASGIRENVVSSIDLMTGLEVTEVNIEVLDVHIATDDESSTPRVE